MPTDVAELRGWLTAGASVHEAAVLRLLADLPGITVTGIVTDRTGRAGEAFSITSRAHGLPAQYTVIVDPRSGALWGYEEVLTTTAGKLNVTIPAVISYRSYLVAEYAPMPR
ncbi:hypothetical protein OG767_00325 [Micromonospora sp. NBC_01392]|uniref:hypothetical protein n=1 Tax=Micromonospora sp. NBC_01392 TaxID=2903588 RepID=UPI003244F34C